MKLSVLVAISGLSVVALFVACTSSDSDAPGASGQAGADSGGGAGTGDSGQAGSSTGGLAGSSGQASAGEAGQAGTGGEGGAAAGGSGGSTSAFVPYFHDDFESYSDGEKLTGNNPFDAAGRTVASTEQAYRGQVSARMEIREGDNGGFGRWGGIIPIQPQLGKGSDVWARLYVYWPASFEFSATPWMKFIRLHNRSSSGENAGYNDLYVDEADSTTSVLRTIKEVHNVWAVYDGLSIPRDTWERYEMYLHIDDVSVDEGGNGRVRVWRDDELIFDRTDVPTITEAGGSIDYLYLFTYWNNEQPPNNHCYIDDLTIATNESPPPNTDAAGNARIGDW